jgi:hypothetical protein
MSFIVVFDKVKHFHARPPRNFLMDSAMARVGETNARRQCKHSDQRSL